MLSSNPLKKKKTNLIQKKDLGGELLHTVIKVLKLHFSLTIPLITFSHKFFATFSTNSKSASNSAFFFIPI